jgi:hypothetical protein
LSQLYLVGLGGGAQHEVADLELGGAKQLAGTGTHQGTGHLEQLLVDRLFDTLGEQLGLGFLSSR